MTTYADDPVVRAWIQRILPHSKEKEPQAAMEMILHNVYPTAQNFSVVTKYRGDTTEPDNNVFQHIFYHHGDSTLDVLKSEHKRPKEKLKTKDFDKVAKEQLDAHLADSRNPPGSTLYGTVTVGPAIKFYKKVLPDGQLQPTHDGFFHLLDDAITVQEWLDYTKLHVAEVEQVEQDDVWSGWTWTDVHQKYVRSAYINGNWQFEYADTVPE